MKVEPHINFLLFNFHRDGEYHYSTLYTPFTQRPEIAEDDYIPLPTVTRKYLNPPPDLILDSIASLPYPFRARLAVRRKLENRTENQPPSLFGDNEVTPSTSSSLPSLSSSLQNTTQLLHSKEENGIGNGQIDHF